MKRTRIRIPAVIAALLVATAIPLSSLAQKPPLLPDQTVSALSNELSGEIAKRNLEGITRFHRQRGSQGFHSAAEIILERARAYGLTDAQILQFPRRRENLLRHAAFASALGRRIRRALGTRQRPAHYKNRQLRCRTGHARRRQRKRRRHRKSDRLSATAQRRATTPAKT